MSHAVTRWPDEREAVVNRSIHEVAPGVSRLRTLFVNVYFVGDADGWILVDAGVPGYAGAIVRHAEELFGRDARPEAIVLTHGHFDHVGSLLDLVERWDVPVYAHRLEMPYITGRSKYAPPDPTVGGGAMAAMSFLYPRGPIDLAGRQRTLPADGALPALDGWRWIHTPGHTAGHVSLFRDDDGVLIAGDAFVTTKQESALAVMTQRREIHGPPAYFTPDWDAARDSVERLAALEPAVAATGHGVPMYGSALAASLRILARDFDRVARPHHGRYVRYPARADDRGVVSVPPARVSPALVAGAALALVVAGALIAKRRRT